MNNKILISLFLMFFLSLTFVSGFDFDNWKTFEQGDLEYGKVIIENAFGLPLIGVTLAEITLDENTDVCSSHCSAKGTSVLYYEDKLLSSLRFKKLIGTGWKYEDIKDYKIYIKTDKLIDVDDNEYTCEEGSMWNGTYTTCFNKKIGTHKEYVWEEYKGQELPAGTYEWKITGEKEWYETVDWLATFLGVEVDDWALWGVGSDLTTYYNFNETSATNISNVVDNSRWNATMGGGMESSAFTTGKIGDGLFLNGSTYFTTDENFSISNTSFSLSMWLQPNAITNEIRVFNELMGWRFTLKFVNNNFTLLTDAGWTDFGDVSNFTWNYIAITYNGSQVNFYKNGTNTKNFTGTLRQYGETESVFGADGIFNNPFNGTMDEIGMWNRTINTTEVSDLWNNGGGLGYGGIGEPTLTINLITPEDDITLSTTGENFTANYTISSSYNFTNVTYYLWNSTGVFNDSVIVSITGISNSTTEFINNFTLGDYEWNTLVCFEDATGTTACNFTTNYSFFVGASIEEELFNNNTYETANEIFQTNISLLSGTTLYSADLIYNETINSGGITSFGSDSYSLLSNIDVPILNESSADFPFHWDLTYQRGDGSFVYQNLTFYNQTAYQILLTECNATYGNTTLNFTLKEEATFSLLNGSLDATYDYWVGAGDTFRTYSFSNSSENNTQFKFCISPGWATFKTDATISYYKDLYDRREYFLTNYTINNITEDIGLYLKTTASTDIFTFTVIDENNDEIEGAYIRVQRWDIGTDNFYTVAMLKTTSDGTAVVNLRLNDAWYRYQVLYNNRLYLTTEPTKESGTTRTLQINLAIANPYLAFDEIDYTFSFNNNTNTFVFVYADTTGAAQIGCLRVLELRGNSTTQYSESCVESTSGTISIPVVGNGTFIGQAIIRLTSDYDNVEEILDELIRTIGIASRFLIIGKFGQVISLAVVGTMAMIGVAAGSIFLGITLIILSLIAVNLAGWLNVSVTVLYGLVSIAILIGLVAARRRR